MPHPSPVRKVYRPIGQLRSAMPYNFHSIEEESDTDLVIEVSVRSCTNSISTLGVTFAMIDIVN